MTSMKSTLDSNVAVLDVSHNGMKKINGDINLFYSLHHLFVNKIQIPKHSLIIYLSHNSLSKLPTEWKDMTKIKYMFKMI